MVRILTSTIVVDILFAFGPVCLAQRLQLHSVYKDHAERVTAVTFSPDGKKLAIATSNYDKVARKRHAWVDVWNVSTRKRIDKLTGPTDEIHALTYSPSGKALACGAYRNVYIWTLGAGRPAILKLPGYLRRLQYSSNGKRLGWNSLREAGVWDIPSKKLIAKLQFSVAPYAGGSAFSPDLSLFAAGNYQDVDLWNADNGKRVASLFDHRGRVEVAAFSADGRRLVTLAILRTAKDVNLSEIRLWDVASKKQLGRFDGPIGQIRFMAISLDKKWLVIAGGRDHENDPTIKIVGLPNGQAMDGVVFTGSGRYFTCMALSPNGRFLAVGDFDNNVRVWQVTTDDKKNDR